MTGAMKGLDRPLRAQAMSLGGLVRALAGWGPRSLAWDQESLAGALRGLAGALAQ